MEFRKPLAIICSFIIPFVVFSQDWDVYMARYEKGVGSTLVDMSLKAEAPSAEFPYLVSTGVKFKDCLDGMPSKIEFSSLHRISDSVQEIISKATGFKLAGTFTYQCQRKDYYYVSDTSGLRKKLELLYAGRFQSYEPLINIRIDSKWEAYLTFLYPNEETLEFMKNQKVILKLQEAGDNLTKARQIDHWIFFKSPGDRDCFESYARQNNFQVGEREKIDYAEYPFKLKISRIDKVDLQKISELSLSLRKQAIGCGGKYDGWETAVVR
jgi:hypothetical protein